MGNGVIASQAYVLHHLLPTAQNTAVTNDWVRDIDTLLCDEKRCDLASNVMGKETGLSFGNVPVPENQNAGSSYSSNDNTGKCFYLEFVC